jgi:hypothetical protein
LATFFLTAVGPIQPIKEATLAEKREKNILIMTLGLERAVAMRRRPFLADTFGMGWEKIIYCLIRFQKKIGISKQAKDKA